MKDFAVLYNGRWKMPGAPVSNPARPEPKWNRIVFLNSFVKFFERKPLPYQLQDILEVFGR